MAGSYFYLILTDTSQRWYRTTIFDAPGDGQGPELFLTSGM
jgi:hypothetical protein